MKSSTRTLYILSIIGSGCGFVTQMLVSGYWATTYSNDVFMFSVNVAFYLLSLGLGAMISTKWKTPTLSLLFEITILLCLWTGVSIVLLRLGISHFGNQVLLPIAAVIIAGILSGHVIPLTLRIGKSDPKMRLSTLFFFDYTAAILFTLLFTFVFLIPYGYGKTSLILSLSSLVITVVLMVMTRTYSRAGVVFAVAVVAIPYPLYRSVSHRVAPTMDSSGEAKVLISHQSHYQKIVLTEEPASPLFPDLKQHVLYLDGFVQFSSMDEQTYHLCIANLPVAAVEFMGSRVKNALILGGGDGLAARNLAQIKSVEKVTMVELDPSMIGMAYHNRVVRRYNQDSLRNPKVKVIIADAFRWVKTTKDRFDLIIIDFPAPKNLNISRLFSAEFYRGVFKLLSPKGFVSIQAGPSFARDDDTLMTISRVTSCVRKTVGSLGYEAHVYSSRQDEDAFVLATAQKGFDMEAFAEKAGITRPEGMGLICRYSPHWKESEVKVNTLNTLVLTNYMLAWFKNAGGPFFNYRGRHAVFLPE